MQFHPSYNPEKCRELVAVSEDMISKSSLLVSGLRSKAPASEIVATCKDFVALTRTLDALLDELASQEPGAKADALNLSKATSKKAVHTLLKAVKESQTSGLSEALNQEVDGATQALDRAFLKAKTVLTVPEKKGGLSAPQAAEGPVESPATQRFQALKKQVASKDATKAKEATKAKQPITRQYALGMSTNLVDINDEDVQAQSPSAVEDKKGFGAPPVASPGIKRSQSAVPGRGTPLMGTRGASTLLSTALARLGPLDEERNIKLLNQFDAKCRWLEDELYRSSEVHVVLRILQAQNLSPLDPNGKSDPYCVVKDIKSHSGAEIRTKVVKETLDPVWDESFEFRLTSNSNWCVRIDLLDWDSDSVSKPLGFVELRATDWLLTTKERKVWMGIQGGSGSIYVGLKSSQHLGLSRVEGDKYRCGCCSNCDIPDLFACEKCGKQTCALCIGLFMCDSCREDLCKRGKLKQAAEAEEAVVASTVSSVQESEFAAAQRTATLLDLSEWKDERYDWHPWSAQLGDRAVDANMLVVPKSYGVEHGNQSNPPLNAGPIDLTMLDPFETYPHYTKHLIKADHGIFIGSVAESSTPVVLVVEKLSYNASGEQVLRALVFSPDGTRRERLVVDPVELSNAGSTSKKSSSGLTVGSSHGRSMANLLAVMPSSDLRSFLMEKFSGLSLQRVPVAAHTDVASKLLEYERNHTDIRRRIGVLFFPKGVREENAVFKSTGSPDLFEFMDLMAERVKLQGWSKYAGGLNTQNNSTGFESYYTEFLGFNIMFHVNCMLEDDGSEQQLSRKRFIGNDLVVFIFLEGDEPFDASMITSQMCHTFIVIKKIASKPTRYRVSVVAKPGVPAFSPFLTFPNEFEKSDKLRQFLLAKALNGNRATFQAKTFLQKTKRTRKDLLARMLKDLNDENVLQHSPQIVFAADQEPSPILLAADNVQLKVHTDFIAEDPTFLSLRSGDIVTAVTANPQDVYWTGILNGRVGRFPSKNVELASLKSRSIAGIMKEKSFKVASASSSTGSPRSGGVLAGNALYRIRFYQGRNMSVCDPWGTSDPYCTIATKDVNGKPIKTKVIQRTLNPVWDQAFEFNASSPAQFRVEVWDKDLVGVDDSMGFVDILTKDWNLSKIGHEEKRWIPMVDGDGDIEIGMTLLQDEKKK